MEPFKITTRASRKAYIIAYLLYMISSRECMSEERMNAHMVS